MLRHRACYDDDGRKGDADDTVAAAAVAGQASTFARRSITYPPRTMNDLGDDDQRSAGPPDRRPN